MYLKRKRGRTSSKGETCKALPAVRSSSRSLDLPETERAVLAAHLLGSLPSVLHDEDQGIAEALRRDAEFEANPSLGMSLEELDQRIESRRS